MNCIKAMAFSVSVIYIFVVPSLYAAGDFSYSFDEFIPGDSIVDVENGLSFMAVESDPPLTEGTIRKYQDDKINRSKVLEHKSRSGTVMTRIVNTRTRPLSGDIMATLDIRPIEGNHSVYLWSGQYESREERLVISFSGNGQILATQKDRSMLNLGKYSKDHWLQVVVCLHIHVAKNTSATYDIVVRDLTVGRTIVSKQGIAFPGDPCRIRGGQLLSTPVDTRPDGACVEARFDNWRIVPFKKVQTKGQDPSRQYVFFEGFDLGSLDNWNISKYHTCSYARIRTTGHLSPTSLEVNKLDTAGRIQVEREVIVPPGERVEIKADIQSVKIGPFAEYYMLIEQHHEDKIVDSNRFAFNDGVTVPNNFGGYFKSPQTLGKWKTTRHEVRVREDVTKIKIAFVFRKGSQTIRVDNVRIRPIKEDEQSADIPVFERSIGSAAAFLDLNMLLPGCVYELIASVNSDNLNGYGARVIYVDDEGHRGDPVTLIPENDQNRIVKFKFAVPDSTVRVLLDMYNSDLKSLGAYRVAKYRKWEQVSIYKVGSVPAKDTLINNYIHRMEPDPELTRPREMVEVTDYDRTVIEQELRSRKPLDTKVEKYHGGMLLRIGDKRYPPMINTSFWPGYDYLSEHAKHGFNIARVKVPGGPGISGNWIGPNEYNFSNVDKVIYQALKQNPQALIVLDIGGLYPPAWWGEAHPEELIRDVHGRACCMYGENLYRCFWGRVNNGALRKKFNARYGLEDKAWHQNYGAKHNTTYLPSPASEAYRDVMRTYLNSLVAYLESRPVGNAVIGYHLTWGEDTQWKIPTGRRHNFFEGEGRRPWKSSAKPAPLDYSKPMVTYFRSYLRQKYGSNQALQAAWNDPTVTLATATIPTPAQRTPKFSNNPEENVQLKFLLNPATEKHVIDYNACYARVVGDLVNEMGLAVKNASSRKVITTAYFQGKARDMGHEFVLRGGGLDISGGPDYWARTIGQSGISPHVASSFRLHGKVDFTEVDHRVFPVVYRSYSYNQLFETPEKTISVLQREFARQMCLGGGAWTLDLGMGWYNHPLVASILGKIYNTFEKVLESDRSSPAQIAIFINDYTYYSTALQGHTTFRYYLAGHIRAMMAHAGVPVDMYYLSDLPLVADRYKVFVFPHSYALTNNQRKMINILKSNDNLLVFGPGSGFVNSEGMSANSASSLMGIELEQDNALLWTAQISNSTNPITREIDGYYIGNSEESNPRINYPMLYITDSEAVPLAVYSGDEKHRTAIALKDHGSWQSLYIGAMGLYPPELFRGLARYKGLHCYSNDGDVMFISKDLIAIHASTEGVKTIRLPEERHVQSLWDNKNLGRLSQIRRYMRVGENALYMLDE